MDQFLNNQLTMDDKSDEMDKILYKANRHLNKAPGQKVRDTFIRALTGWMPDVPSDVITQVEDVWKLTHEASLLLDDIQDNSILRRGLPAAYTIFGTASTVITIDVLVNEAHAKLLKLKGLAALKIGIYHEAINFQGQGIELYWTTRTICPTEDQYLVMVSKKTAAAFVVISKLLQLFSKTDVTHLMELFGQYYQIRNDYQDLTSKEFKTIGFAYDITEGKFGFPTVHACNNHPEVSDALKGILKQHTNDVKLKKQYIKILEKCGSFEYTKKLMDERKAVIEEEVEKLGKSKAVEDLLALGY